MRELVRVVCVRTILLTGMSGTGTSTALEVLVVLLAIGIGALSSVAMTLEHGAPVEMLTADRASETIAFNG